MSYYTKKALLYIIILCTNLRGETVRTTIDNTIIILHDIGWKVQGSYTENGLQDIAHTQTPYVILKTPSSTRIEASLDYANQSIPFFQARASLPFKKMSDPHAITYDFDFIIEKLTSLQAFDDEAQEWVKKTVATFLFTKNDLSTTEYDILSSLMHTVLRVVVAKWRRLALLLKDTINETVRTGNLDIETRKKLELTQQYLKDFNTY